VAADPVAAYAVSRSSARTKPITVALWGIGALVVGLLLVEAVNWISSQFDRSVLLGILAAGSIAAGVGGVCYCIANEALALMRLRQVERHRLALDELERQSPAAIDREIATLLSAIPQPAPVVTATANFYHAIQPHHTAAQRIALLSMIVLRPLDESAESAIRRAVAYTVAVSSVSPTALGDAVFIMGCGIRLVREIAEIYGHHPGVAGTAHLVRKVLRDAGAVGTLDLVGNAAAAHLSNVVLDQVGTWVSAKAAESAFAAQRMARLGVLTINACRPVAFGRDEGPTVTKILTGTNRN
jgi:putative membrane protein